MSTPHVEKQSYFHILRSMAMIGGSSAINVLFSIVRTKALAVLLGPAGVGQLSLYMSIVDLAQAILYRGAGLTIVWPQLLAILGIGALFFSAAQLRFRQTLAQMA